MKRIIAVPLNKRSSESAELATSNFDGSASLTFNPFEYSIEEFSAFSNPASVLGALVDKPGFLDGQDCKCAWVLDGDKYYFFQTYLAPTQTDTERRDAIKEGETSRYVELFEYRQSLEKNGIKRRRKKNSSNTTNEVYALIAKVRCDEAGGRSELVRVNAGKLTPGNRALDLINQLIQKPFQLSGLTLHDESKIMFDGIPFSLSKLRKLAGKEEGSIYKRVGFHEATLYRQSVGQYENHTQIPHIAKLATDCVREVPLPWLLNVFIPLVKEPQFSVPLELSSATSTQTKLYEAMNRWCLNLKNETVQTLFSQLLEASKYFKVHTKSMFSQAGQSISKSVFYSDLNLFQNVMLAEVYTPADELKIRQSFDTVYQQQKAMCSEEEFKQIRWNIHSAAVLQCAIDCLQGHIIFEHPIEPGYSPLSMPINESAVNAIPDFRNAILQLSDSGQVPLTWLEFCRSSRVEALFVRDTK